MSYTRTSSWRRAGREIAQFLVQLFYGRFQDKKGRFKEVILWQIKGMIGLDGWDFADFFVVCTGRLNLANGEFGRGTRDRHMGWT